MTIEEVVYIIFY